MGGIWRISVPLKAHCIPASCCGLQVGGIRRIIVPVELGYPGSDYNTAGPKPATFSGVCIVGAVMGWRG